MIKIVKPFLMLLIFFMHNLEAMEKTKPIYEILAQHDAEQSVQMDKELGLPAVDGAELYNHNAALYKKYESNDKLYIQLIMVLIGQIVVH